MLYTVLLCEQIVISKCLAYSEPSMMFPGDALNTFHCLVSLVFKALLFHLSESW